MTLPILYSFRRCPYAIRARLGVASAGVKVELREVILRDKAPEFLATSPTATVPCLKAGDLVLDESFDIMLWALEKHDPEGWLKMPALGFDLVAENDGPFKTALDRYKYSVRHKDVDVEIERHKAGIFLHKINNMLGGHRYLFTDLPCFADMAILPFVRQFAHVDLDWFTAQPWPDLARWLEAFKASDRFTSVMTKYSRWYAGDPITVFP